MSVSASLVIRFGVWAVHLRVVRFLLVCVHRFDHISERVLDDDKLDSLLLRLSLANDTNGALSTVLLLGRSLLLDASAVMLSLFLK